MSPPLAQSLSWPLPGAEALRAGLAGLSPLLVPGLAMAATWESWRWYAGRVSAVPEEAAPLLLSLAFLALLAFPRWLRREPPAAVPLLPLALLLAVYALLTLLAVPQIFRAAVAALAVLWALYRAVLGCAPPPAFYGMMALALPVLPSLQFLLGYPMRLVSAVLTVALLKLEGLSIARQGTFVVLNGEMVQFDAPCSGVSMLWALVLLTLLVGLLLRFDVPRLALATGAALVASVIGNVLRVTSLLHLELGVFGAPSDGLHEAVGLVAFAMAAAVLLAVVVRLRAPTIESAFNSGRPSERQVALPAFLAAVAVAAAVPLVTAKGNAPAKAGDGFPGWPASYDGRPLSPLPLSAREEAFQRDFPGRIGRFSDGKREIVLRWVTDATRRLHPASDCFRGIGYAIDPLPLRRDATGEVMGCFRATRADQTRTVCEKIESVAGGSSWSDVPAWYWETLFGGARGPWWSIVVAD